MKPSPLTFFITFLYFLATKSGPTKPQLLLTRVGQCRGNKFSQSMVQFSEMSIVGLSDVYYVTGFISVKKDVADGWSVKATKQKCMDMRNVDTCDFLHNFVVVEFACGDDRFGEDLAVSKLFNHTEPRMSCPVKAGIYKLDNYTIRMRNSFFATSEAKMSTSMFGYTLTIEGFDVDDEDRIFCAEVYLQLSYPRFTPIAVELDLDLDSADPDETTEEPDETTADEAD